MEEIRHGTLVPSESEVPTNRELTDKPDIVAYAQKVPKLEEEAPKNVTTNETKPAFPTEGNLPHIFFPI